MHETVYPRYTLFEKFVLGVLYVLELPFRVLRMLAGKSRKHFEKLYLDEVKERVR